MLFPTLDIALRAGTVTVLLLLAALLIRDSRTVVAGRLAIALALGSAIHAVSAGFSPPVTPWRAPLIALSTANVVVLWLFARALFDDGFRLRAWHMLVWVAVGGISLANCLGLAPGTAGNVRPFGTSLNSIAISLIALGFIALTVGQTIVSWSADLVEGRRRIRVFIIGAAVVYGSVDAVLRVLTSTDASSEIANTVNAALLAGITVAIAWCLMRLGGDEVFSMTPAVKAAAEVSARVISITSNNPNAADQKLIDTLRRLMAVDRIYRDENMTIGTLALRLNVPEYRLRRLINQRLGYRNFNVFLNDHRIEEARVALADPAQAEVPVITIAMDAGFQSLGPFNRAFKATTGVTPSDYRRLHANPPQPSKPLVSSVNFEIG